ncbi:NAD(P)/FAD-dependent oxidoreductase [Pseudonocardia hydrocarbonoxydans]|uniref:Ferredoxin reductase n=1 Tax=Pseudonocardia hydrocarbonoxydans TaxID=76726 RepID=A0A4Y3WJF9_9PSEU|nr:FAD-dependent oxidoreductase [Pseudonocardia hydrocarbonoxydans]GEC18039.1 ferredoxin reductase [Pseudonocardia hydrocarbonoxydans]
MARAGRVVVVGAGLAGLRTAEELRAAGHDGPLTLVGAEEHLPYDRPPLSKQVLTGSWEPERVALRSADALAELSLDLRLGTRATGLADDAVVLGDGERLPFDHLVVATGVAARRLAHQPRHERVHELRTLEDCLRLQAGLAASRSLLIVGGGFVGAEVAAAARAQGLDVTIVEALPAPFGRVLGTAVAQRCVRLHRDHGVRVLAGARVEELRAGEDGVVLTLADGSVLEADRMLVAVGTSVDAGWAGGTGGAGLACDDHGRVAGRDRVYAVGDVAAWHSPATGDRERVEHWTSATEQARVAARALLGRPVEPAAADLPYFWSDQYRTKIQMVGRPHLADTTRIHDTPGGAAPSVAVYLRRGRLVAAVSFAAPHLLARLRPLVAGAAPEPEVRALTDALGLVPA